MENQIKMVEISFVDERGIKYISYGLNEIFVNEIGQFLVFMALNECRELNCWEIGSKWGKEENQIEKLRKSRLNFKYSPNPKSNLLE